MSLHAKFILGRFRQDFLISWQRSSDNSASWVGFLLFCAYNIYTNRSIDTLRLWHQRLAIAPEGPAVPVDSTSSH